MANSFGHDWGKFSIMLGDEYPRQLPSHKLWILLSKRFWPLGESPGAVELPSRPPDRAAHGERSAALAVAMTHGYVVRWWYGGDGPHLAPGVVHPG